MGVIDAEPAREETAHRLADAALLLLDVAREAAKEGPDYRPGQVNLEKVLCLAVQAVAFADHWKGQGKPIEAHEVTDFRRRLTGVGAGLGALVGNIRSIQDRVSAMRDISSAMTSAMMQRDLVERKGRSA